MLFIRTLGRCNQELHYIPGNGLTNRLHIDFVGPFMGQMLLVIIDAHSKWLEVYITNSSASAVTVEKLRDAFSKFMLSDMIILVILQVRGSSSSHEK